MAMSDQPIMLSRCPLCGQLVRLVQLRNGRSWRMVEMDTLYHHADYCGLLREYMDSHTDSVARLHYERRTLARKAAVA